MNSSDHLPDSVFIALRDLILERTGIYYEENKRYLLIDKLNSLVTERGMTNLADYYYLLKQSQDTDGEWRRVESALAVNESYFWREFDQISAVTEVIMPRLQSERPATPVRIWHAGCAAGEEPYTMAIALTEAARFLYGPIDIIATDFNSNALTQAREGVYRERSFRAIPPDIRARYFTLTKDGRFRLDDAIRSRVHFKYLNLVDDIHMDQMISFDIIFCRNIFIYFSKEAIKKVINHFYRSLRMPGYLFTGSAESLLKLTTDFELVDVGDALAYKKV